MVPGYSTHFRLPQFNHGRRRTKIGSKCQATQLKQNGNSSSIALLNTAISKASCSSQMKRFENYDLFNKSEVPVHRPAKLLPPKRINHSLDKIDGHALHFWLNKTKYTKPPCLLLSYKLAAMQKSGTQESIIRSRSRSPEPKRRPTMQIYVKSRSRSPMPDSKSDMLAFSKQKATPPTSTDKNIKAGTKTKKTEEVATEVLGNNNMINEIRGPYNTGAPFSCIRCGHQSFLALCKESEIVWAVRCLHCYLIHPIQPIYAT